MVTIFVYPFLRLKIVFNTRETSAARQAWAKLWFLWFMDHPGERREGIQVNIPQFPILLFIKIMNSTKNESLARAWCASYSSRALQP